MNKMLTKPEKPTTQSWMFVSAALDMSWRLALAVLVPIIGGVMLDKKLGFSPLLTVFGFVIAAAGAGLVMWRTLQATNQLQSINHTDSTKTQSVVTDKNL